MDLSIGVVGYANAAPLVSGLPALLQAQGLPRGSIRRGLPCEVADWLARGEVDVALLPAIELARLPGATAVRGWGIAADGACASVFLYTKARLADVKRVRLDGASRTAASLTRILLDREGASDVSFERTEQGSVADRLDGFDAALLIGDPALAAVTPAGVTRLDLASEWKRHVGLPFVFACWASRAGRRLTAVELALLDAAAEDGLARLSELAEVEARRTGLPVDRLEQYLRLLQYRLDDRHWQGLQAFLDEAYRVGILSSPPDPSVYS